MIAAAFLYITYTKLAFQNDEVFNELFRVNRIIVKYDKDSSVNWRKLHVSYEQTCMCLIHSVYIKCENVCVFAKTKP